MGAAEISLVKPKHDPSLGDEKWRRDVPVGLEFGLRNYWYPIALSGEVFADKAKRIDAALVNSPLELILYREGFSKLAFAGDYANTPAAGIGVTDKKIKDNPDEVLAFVKGTLKGIQYFKQNPSEAINFIIKELAVKDPLLAAQVYDTRVGLFAGSAVGKVCLGEQALGRLAWQSQV